MILIGEQVETIKERINRLQQETADFIQGRSNQAGFCFPNGTNDIETEIQETIARNNKDIAALTYYLQTAQLQLETTDEQVDIGTEFDLLVTTRNGKEKMLTGVLIAERTGVEKPLRYYTLDSSLGQALYQHKAGDTISYKAPNGNTVVGEIIGLRKTSTTSKEQEVAKAR